MVLVRLLGLINVFYRVNFGFLLSLFIDLPKCPGRETRLHGCVCMRPVAKYHCVRTTDLRSHYRVLWSSFLFLNHVLCIDLRAGGTAGVLKTILRRFYP